LSAAQEALTNSLKQLNESAQETQKSLTSLENRIGEAEKELARLSVPISWLPLDAHSFVACLPALSALAFFFLALRLTRLSKFRQRLISEMAQARAADREIHLALWVPNTVADLVFSPQAGPGSQLRFFRGLAALPILAFLAFLLLRLHASPAFKTDSMLLTDLLVGALAILIVILLWQSFRRYQTSAQSAPNAR
jgi:hypothetical protein